MKKLTKKHIPKGYKYAIVTDRGNAWATIKKPVLYREYKFGVLITAYWTNLDPVSRLIGKGFETSDWQNSLIKADNEKDKI
jgi:hypothetical protein